MSTGLYMSIVVNGIPSPDLVETSQDAKQYVELLKYHRDNFKADTDEESYRLFDIFEQEIKEMETRMFFLIEIGC